MKLLFVLNSHATTNEALGMAQLSAAFGQEVALWFPVNALDETQLAACQEAGIAQMNSDIHQLPLLLAHAERVVRL